MLWGGKKMGPGMEKKIGLSSKLRQEPSAQRWKEHFEANAQG